MYLIAHTGLTLGAGWLLKRYASTPVGPGTGKLGSEASAHPDSPLPRSPWRAFIDRLDLRILVLGGLLPDIIDKPLGLIALHSLHNNGRLFFHTLLVLAVLGLAGWLLYRRGNRAGLLTLTLGMAAHLGLDAAWQEPRTFFWPFPGFDFPRYTQDFGLAFFWERFTTIPSVYGWEILGGLAFLGVFTWLVRNHALRAFIRAGQIRPPRE